MTPATVDVSSSPVQHLISPLPTETVSGTAEDRVSPVGVALTQEESILLAQLRLRAEVSKIGQCEEGRETITESVKTLAASFSDGTGQPARQVVKSISPTLPDPTSMVVGSVDQGSGKGSLKFSVRQYDSNTFKPFTFTPNPVSSQKSPSGGFSRSSQSRSSIVRSSSRAHEDFVVGQDLIPADAVPIDSAEDCAGSDSMGCPLKVAEDTLTNLMNTVRSTRRPSTAPSRSNVTFNDRVTHGVDGDRMANDEARATRYSQMARSKPSLHTLVSSDTSNPPSNIPRASSVDKVENGPDMLSDHIDSSQAPQAGTGYSRASTSGRRVSIVDKGSTTPSVQQTPGSPQSRPGTARGRLAIEASGHSTLLTGLRLNVANAIAANGSISALPTVSAASFGPLVIKGELEYGKKKKGKTTLAYGVAFGGKEKGVGAIARGRHIYLSSIRNKRSPLMGHELSPLGLTVAGSAGDEVRILAPSCTFGRTDGVRILRGQWERREGDEILMGAKILRKRLKEADLGKVGFRLQQTFR
ncbi:hypothetical protein HDU67_002317 [Dinochytrium kinnereticum]|nr:hypothetical protein HDU67_002317 [Dinochytrium kinnereticum]